MDLFIACSVRGQNPAPCKQDTLIKQTVLVNGTLSASYVDQHNWEENTRSSISILGSCDLRYHFARNSGWEGHHSLRTEISYVRYYDSIWTKNSDYVKLQMQWIEPKGKKLTHSYSVYFGTQWLNSTQSIKTETGYKKVWAGGIFNPATLEINYGVNKDLWKNSRLSIAFASVKLTTRPRKAYEFNIVADPSLFVTKHSYIRSEYGFSAQLELYEEIFEKVLLFENNSRFFFNGLNRKAVNLDFNNRIAIRFLKVMQLRFDTGLIYDPEYSTRIQYRQEVLLGVFFENRTLRKR
jgi:hypothetical protein